MSSFTQAQLDALTAAIAEGALRVKYQDKEVEFRSLNEMLKLKALMEAELNPDTDNPLGTRRAVGVYGSGI